jgi:O-antigen/teichoic acid export membrane protein
LPAQREFVVRSGRAQRLLGGLGLGYLHTAGTVLVGLWLTPFLLGRLGSHDYGLWLLGAQVVFYLGLMDLGVVALIPREVASASGLDATDRVDAIKTLVAQTVRVVLWQLPAVAIAGAAIVWLLPSEWMLLRGPIGIVVLVFVVAFPFRVSLAVLQGLQDLAFVGAAQLTSWAAGTIVTVGGVFGGLGLYSLTFGWVTTQVVSAVMAWVRLVHKFPEVVPARLPLLTLKAVWTQIGRGAWISVSQFAQVLLSGTDLVIVGKLLGPEAVVPYACTGRLVTMLANQPQMFMQLALPALSELRTSASRQRLFEVSHGMTQTMLLASGAIVVVVLATNEAFVTWWVGQGQYGGVALTVLLLVGMLIRHLNTTAIYALFCFGNERRLAVTAIAEGVGSAVITMILVPMFGLYGAALGPTLGTCLIGLPNNLRALAREEGTSATSLLAPLAPWLARLSVLLAGVSAFLSAVRVAGLAGLVTTSAVVAIAYLAIMLPVLRTPPLGPMLIASLQPWTDRAPALVRRRPASL